MQEIKVNEPAQIKVIFGGKEYFLRKPNNGEARALRQHLRSTESDPDAQEEFIMKFLEERGLPREVGDALDLDCLSEIIDALSAKKKS